MNRAINPDPLFQDSNKFSRIYVCPKCGEVSEISDPHYSALSDALAQDWIIDVGVACGACSSVNRFSEIRRQISSRESITKGIVENISTG